MTQSEQNDKIFTINETGFAATAREMFRFQYENNLLYKRFSDSLGIRTPELHKVEQIPFLPIHFFKSHVIQTTSFAPQAIFESSGTTGTVNSRHGVKDLQWYEQSFTRAFELFYGSIKGYCILGLLPSYIERKNSSLVYMTQRLIRLSGHPDSGFYLNEFDKLLETLDRLERAGQKTILIGVTFALLDFAEKINTNENTIQLRHTLIMETGGMKGRREEMIRDEVHQILKSKFQVSSIHSEYGMTELLSQAYSKENGIFRCPPWMKILVRDDEDPAQISHQGMGLLNIIDFANIYSCSFIATDDIGKVFEDGSFEVLGRKDNSDLRGCSLLVV
ncbi:MAG: acyl transferase [Bacteroidetes bacterium]|nr:acyl transferase [Bacteroidota bacterium]MBS1932114.1 acyl transferase [Bacteroidota bacterium]